MDKLINDPIGSEENLDLKQEFRKYLRFWPWYILALATSLACTYIYLRYTPRIYSTNAKIKVLDESDGIEMPTSAFVFKRSNINLENEIEIIKSYIIMERVVKALNLNTRFYVKGKIQTVPIAELPFKFEHALTSDKIKGNHSYTIIVNEHDFTIKDDILEKTFNFPNHTTYAKTHNLPFNIALSKENTLNTSENLINQTYQVKLGALRNAVLALKSQITITPVGEGSDILNLKINGQNKARSEKIINTLIDIFNKDGINDRQSISKRTLEFVEERFVLLAQELDSIEINRKVFKQENNLIDFATDAQTSVQQNIKSDESLFNIEKDLAIVELTKDVLLNASNSALLPASLSSDNSLNALIENYNSIILNKRKLMNSSAENNPMIKIIDADIKSIKSNIDKFLKENINRLKELKKQLTSRSVAFSNKTGTFPKKEKLLRAIERQQKIKESLYLLLLQKREEAAINYAITEPSVKVVEYAISDSTPIYPKPKYFYIVAMIIGLIIPLGIVYLKFFTNTKIHSKEDIIKLNSTTPVIAEIPIIKTENQKVFSDPNNNDILAESFRILSSNVNYILPKTEDNKGKVIYCTSTVKGEGKTYISLNLSLALSSINKKVLLIGSDLRNPQIHTQINFDKNHLGLSNYLYDTGFDWHDGLVNGFKKHNHHHILLSGSIPPNPTHLLTNGRFKKLLEDAKLEYDYIIVDTAPTILVTDTMLISQFADATIFVTRADYTEKKLLNFSKDLSETGKIKNMAYVVNAVGSNKSYGYKYGYKYNYNYGYGYGYGSDKEA